MQGLRILGQTNDGLHPSLADYAPLGLPQKADPNEVGKSFYYYLVKPYFLKAFPKN